MKRTVLVLVAALCATVLAPLGAQQAVGPVPAAVTSASPVSAPNSALPGPRVQPEYQRFEPSLSDSSVSHRTAMMGGGSHTIVISTLALILIVVIVVLLVTK